MYALWLVPGGQMAVQLSDCITALANEYDGPVFAPHITLLGKIDASEAELVTNTQRLAGQIDKIHATVSGVAGEPFYYKSLYLEIAKTAELDHANKLARENFNTQGQYEFRPHLSLLYGDQSEEVKQQACSDITVEAGMTIELTGLQLIAAFGTTQDWRILSNVALGG